ncbi:MAG: hypothetical protein LPJ86_07435 [Caulobacteraceae bacterium]|nr:hypothetical protein [Caulobacteraceae bacterium]MDX5393640.1 hypothetical protein [Caulobacteraceae bacterium]
MPTEAMIDHPFPTIRAAGLFLMGVGAIFALGWVFPRRFTLFMGLAFAVGGFAAYVGYALPPDLGPIRQLDIWVYGLAILAEIVGIALVYRRVEGERAQDAWMLMVVGAHFLPMVLAFGPAALALALACMANAALALRRIDQPILPFGLTDSALKVATGVWLFMAYPTANFANFANA